MAASTSGAIKARLEGLAFGVPVFRDGPREGQEPPFVVVQEGMPAGIDTAAAGDAGDDPQIIETVTVDLVQHARAKTGVTTTKNAERYGLAEAIAAALHGQPLPAHPAKVTSVRVTGIDRFPIADNRVRHSIDVQIRRALLLAEVIPG
ncbi:hypothetical protein ACFWFU_06910 [Streptomyces sp. NPDC060235]|uniref:hypothetical protein n=1 Tax=Streptomyces sp. NPDC060235 TaxID=3347080 RepID=UPI003665D06D